ncbi:MAG: DUF452 family protein [Tannerella sp.]|jgi:hypothetical protein|nr:DUF452 family protein [Tannerella sp.]
MIIKKLNSAKASPELLLFFAGWGMDECPFLEYLPAGRDCMICYDYRSLSFDASLPASYRRIRVVAWSMGVWAASRVLSGRNLPVSESIAVNGTPWPVDDEKGIATAIFRGTLAGLDETALQKFRRRMCGSKEAWEHFLKHAPQRTLEDLREELDRIGRSSRTPAPAFEWDRIYIGLRDRIFLPASQQRAWEGKNVTKVDCDHYPSTLWPELFNTYG